MIRSKSSSRGSRRARRLKLIMAVMAVAICLSLAVLAIANRAGRFPTKKRETAAVSQRSNIAQRFDKNVHIRRGQLWPHLKDAFEVLGDRLDTSGKERITLTGQASGESTSDFILVQEFPARVRFQQQGNAQPKTIAFDGREGWKLGGNPDRFESAVLETLVYDSVDRLFIAQATGAPTRFLGSRFRLDDGNTEGANAPAYDVYQVNEQVNVGRETRSQTRSYYLNSETLLLERVRYELERDGARTSVEVLLSDWREVQEQKIPFRITRLEDGKPIMILTVAAAAIGPRMSDGIFNQPQGNR